MARPKKAKVEGLQEVAEDIYNAAEELKDLLDDYQVCKDDNDYEGADSAWRDIEVCLDGLRRTTGVITAWEKSHK